MKIVKKKFLGGKAGHFKNFDFLESSNVKLLNYNKGFLALLRLDDLICKCGMPFLKISK